MPDDLRDIAPALCRVTDERMRHVFGDRSFLRGRAFVTQQRVSAVCAQGPLSLSATVVGDTGIYRTEADLSMTTGVLGGDCTCPMGGDCKHVAAAVLAARLLLERDGVAGTVPARLALVSAAPAVPVWEQVLGGIIAPPEPTTPYAPLGLLVELRRTSRGTGATSQLTPAMRPVVPGKTGWVKSGIGWNQLQYGGYGGYGAGRLDPRQLEALQRVQPPSSRYGSHGSSDWLALDGLGAGWVEALRACRRAGMRLLAHQRSGAEVVLAEQPATVSFGLVQAADGAIMLTPSVSLPAELTDLGADVTACWTIGSPPTGVVGRLGGDRLLLAGFDPPLDAATARALAHGEVSVPPEHARRFLSVALPVLARRFPVVSPDDSVDIAEVEPPRLRLDVEHLPRLRLGLTWSFGYRVGETTLDVPIDGRHDITAGGPAGGQAHAAVRDAAAEAALVGAVLRAGSFPALVTDDPFGGVPHLVAHTTLGGFDVVQVLEQVLPALEALDGVDVVISGDPVTYAESPEAPVVHLELTESPGGADWFDLAVEVRVGAEKVPLGQLVTALALGHEQLILPTGTWFRLDLPELARLQQLLDEARAVQDDPGGPLRLSPYQADLWAELEALGVVQEQSERWTTLVEGLSGATTESLPAPLSLRATLRPYQRQGFEWLTFLRRHGLGGVLADDMGLGKTVQALAMILQERDDVAGSAGPAAPWLVVAPTSVLATWASEAARFAPSLRVRLLRETSRRRGDLVPAAVAGADVVVTSYAVLRLDAEQFRAVSWAGLVLDEAQAVKNHQSATYQAARRLQASARFVVSGTPMENNLMELWSLLSIAAPGLFPSPKAFTEHFRKPIESGAAPERLETLRRRIRPVMLRRTKQAVASDLPPKQEQLVRVELLPTHRRLYDRGLARERQRVLGLLDDPTRNRMAIFRSLTRLRQLSLHPGLVDPEDEHVACVKIDTLMEHLGPIVAEGHQALVFSQFTSFLKLVRERLDGVAMPYAYLDGRTRRREQAIDHFRSGAAPVFLISLKAGGTGLTLTEADYVFVLDPWWNPAVEAQAVDRAHRIGQERPVNVYRLVAADTIEDKVVALQDRKRALFASVVDEGALAGGALSPDDIRGLLS